MAKLDLKANCIIVLARLAHMINNDEVEVELFAAQMDDLLDEIRYEDGFGTEAQCDPRGDQRNGNFDMWDIEYYGYGEV